MRAKPTTRIILLGMALLVFGAVNPVHAQNSYLTNDYLKVGVDTVRGGAINYLSEAGSYNSIVNIDDLGRYIQQSYYSGPVPYIPSGAFQHSGYSGWGWNPVQAGDVFNIHSQVINESNDGDTIYTKCVPNQWALYSIESECTMETWVTLDENRVHVRNRLVNFRSDTTYYSGKHQELPAIYTIGTLYRLFTYTGISPFTGDELTQIDNSGPPWEYWNSTENWSALVNDDGWGLGVYNPGTYLTVGGFSGIPNIGGPSSGNTGYIAPLHTDILDHDIVYEFEYTLIVGDLQEDIRSYVYDHAPEVGPYYNFSTDRQHCLMANISDQAPPYEGFWRLELGQADPQVLFPVAQWDASDVPVVYLRAAYHCQNDQAEIFFAGQDGAFTGAKRLAFTIIADGEVHTYELDFASHPEYTGIITRLRFDPLQACASGDVVDLYSLASSAISSVPEIKVPEVPGSHITLEPNFPNPFNPHTTIKYSLGVQAPVDLNVFDSAGHLVHVLLSGVVHSVGTHEIVWNGRDSFGRQVASGAYFYQLRSLNVTQTMKMTLVQ